MSPLPTCSASWKPKPTGRSKHSPFVRELRAAIQGAALAGAQVASATNMTDRLAGLSTLALLPGEPREAALAAFAERYAHEPLVLDKWFAIQAMIPEDGTVERVRGLQAHPAFAMTNPNRVRSLVGSFALANPTQFNRADGAGFALAGFVSPSSFGFLVDRTGSWVVPFIASIVLLLIGALLASRLRPDRPFEQQVLTVRGVRL